MSQPEPHALSGMKVRHNSQALFGRQPGVGAISRHGDVLDLCLGASDNNRRKNAAWTPSDHAGRSRA